MSSSEASSRSSTPGLENEDSVRNMTSPFMARFPGLADVVRRLKVPCIESGVLRSLEC